MVCLNHWTKQMWMYSTSIPTSTLFIVKKNSDKETQNLDFNNIIKCLLEIFKL